MKKFAVPTRTDVSASNQGIFDNLQKMAGFIPNLYAYLAKNETALGDYLTLQNRKSTLSGKEKEIINLVTSQVNECRYCLSAHTAVGKMNGFTDEQIIEIRKGGASFDKKYDALAKLTRSVVENRGKTTDKIKEAFFAVGYTEANLVDAIIMIGDKTITNYLHGVTEVEIDWPLAENI